MLAYAAYLAYAVLAPPVKQHYGKYEEYYKYSGPLSNGGRWSQIMETLYAKLHYLLVYAGIALDVGGVRISGVGMLALLTWPLPLGLLGYHIYLIWAGMTTNESAKWADWRDDMDDGIVFLNSRKENSVLRASISSDGSEIDLAKEEPPTRWPIESRHILLRTTDGKPPNRIPSHIAMVVEEGPWKRCWTLSEVENVYDLGFLDNFLEAMR